MPDIFAIMGNRMKRLWAKWSFMFYKDEFDDAIFKRSMKNR